MLADAGYATEQDMLTCERFGVMLYASYRENTLTKSSEKKSGRRYFKKDVFRWEPEQATYRCPNDAVLTRCSQEFARRNLGEWAMTSDSGPTTFS